MEGQTGSREEQSDPKDQGAATRSSGAVANTAIATATINHWILKVNDILTSPPWREPQNLPVEILPWLWLSSQHGATRPDRLQALQIGHVLTLNAMLPMEASRIEWALRSQGVDHTYIAAYDVEGYNMIGYHWEQECKPLLKQVRENNGKIVVHCQAGQNRSGAIVAAALLELEGWPLLKTIRHLKKIRGIVITNLSFQRQLVELAHRLDLLTGSVDEVDDEEEKLP